MAPLRHRFRSAHTRHTELLPFVHRSASPSHLATWPPISTYILHSRHQGMMPIDCLLHHTLLNLTHEPHATVQFSPVPSSFSPPTPHFSSETCQPSSANLKGLIEGIESISISQSLLEGTLIVRSNIISIYSCIFSDCYGWQAWMCWYLCSMLS